MANKNIREVDRNISVRINRYMNDHGITQDELKDILHLSQSEVNKRLNCNDRVLSASDLLTFAIHERISIDTLFGLDKYLDKDVDSSEDSVAQQNKRSDIEIESLADVMQSIFSIVHQFGLVFKTNQINSGQDEYYTIKDYRINAYMQQWKLAKQMEKISVNSVESCEQIICQDAEKYKAQYEFMDYDSYYKQIAKKIDDAVDKGLDDYGHIIDADNFYDLDTDGVYRHSIWRLTFSKNEEVAIKANPEWFKTRFSFSIYEEVKIRIIDEVVNGKTFGQIDLPFN